VQVQKAFGTGGTVKDGRIEIQGDKRNEVANILTEAGLQLAFAEG
jgi:translation initiation factor 1